MSVGYNLHRLLMYAFSCEGKLIWFSDFSVRRLSKLFSVDCDIETDETKLRIHNLGYICNFGILRRSTMFQ